jgi:glycosyltransferase involved in cell wall biosynthesis
MTSQEPDADVHLHRRDLIRRIQKFRRVRASHIDVDCERASAVAFRDVLDVYLGVSGVESWSFRDSKGDVSQGRRGELGASAARLVRDVATWPFEVARLARTLTSLENEARAMRSPGAAARCLFLRTNHEFDLVAGGSLAHLAGVIGGLDALEIATSVFSSDTLGDIPQRISQRVITPNYGTLRNIPEWPLFAFSEAIADEATRAWAVLRPDFIYQRYSFANYAGVRLKARHGIPFVCEYNGSEVWVARNWGARRLLHRRLLARVEDVNLRAADLVVVVSSVLRDEIVARGVEPSRVLVNPNGVDTTRFSPEIDGRHVRARYALGDAVVIGFIGTFGQWHGAPVLSRAFKLLLERAPDLRGQVKLFMVGDGPTREATTRELRGTSAEADAVFTGVVPQRDAPEHLAACDILVAPHTPNDDGSPFFGSPTKLFEYMAMGRAIAASRLGQIADVLCDGETARITEPGDDAALARSLLELTRDAPLRTRLGARAREDAVAQHTWVAHTRRTLCALRGETALSK